MSRPTPLVSTLTAPARAVLRWPVESQQRARRNALLAATDLADRRREALQVEEFLVDHARKRGARTA
jgi:hypothetical protein